MNSFIAAIKNENQKLFSRKRTYVFLGISAVIPLITLIFLLYFQNVQGIRITESMRFPSLILSFFTGLLLPLFISMNVIEAFTGEVGEGSLKASLLRPVTRFKIFMAKILSSICYTAISLGLVFVVSTLCGLALRTHGSFVSGIAGSFIEYAASLIPLVMITIIVAFISQFFKSSGGALTVCILLFIALKTLSSFFSNASEFFPTSYTNWGNLWTGGYLPVTTLIISFMFMLGYSIIFFASGFYVFERKEL